MMRCKNCGWENAEGAEKCEKCNAPLSGSKKGSNVNDSNFQLNEDRIQRGTVKEGWNHADESMMDGVCPSCHYPLGKNMKVCPMCGDEVRVRQNDEIHSNKCPRCQQEVGVNDKFCSHCGQLLKQGTINGGMVMNYFTLKPIPWGDDGVSYNPIEYSGDTVVLNRANTEPNNQTITSKVQATITYKDGAWYIEDGSELKTTMIHVKHKMKLESGDIIVMGNRKFEFKNR